MALGTSDGQYFENEATYQMRMPVEPDYDNEAFKASGIPLAENGHGPDDFKLPNHITFSDQSVYHGIDGNEGGKWAKLGEDRWSFTPGATNFKNHSLTEMQDYFKKYEPGNVLNATADADLPVGGPAPAAATGPDFSWVDAGDKSPNEVAAERVKNAVKPEGGKKEGMTTDMLSRLGNGVARAAVHFATFGPELLQKVANGEIDPMSDEGIGHALNAAATYGGFNTIRSTGELPTASGTPSTVPPPNAPQFSGGPIFERGLAEYRAALENQRGASGSLERQGSNTFNREVRRSPADGTFRSRAEMEGHWDEFMTNRNTGRRGSAEENRAIDEEAAARDPGRRQWDGSSDTLRRDIHEILGPQTHDESAAILERLRRQWADEPVQATESSYTDGLNRFISGKMPFATDNGKQGFVGYQYNPKTKDIYVSRIGGKNMFGGSNAIQPQEFGFKQTRQLMRDLANKHPDAETISGFRVSGARKKVGSGPNDARIRIPGRGKPILDLEAAE